jgi:predicted DNA-binding transcriptional regulator AlpA
MNSNILTEKEAAIYIGMSRSFLSQDRMNGYREGRTPGPIFLKLGHAIRYRKEDLDAWLMQHRVIRFVDR